MRQVSLHDPMTAVPTYGQETVPGKLAIITGFKYLAPIRFGTIPALSLSDERQMPVKM